MIDLLAKISESETITEFRKLFGLDVAGKFSEIGWLQRYAAVHLVRQHLETPVLLRIPSSLYQEFQRQFIWSSLGGLGYGEAFADRFRVLDPLIKYLRDPEITDLVIRRVYVHE